MFPFFAVGHKQLCFFLKQENYNIIENMQLLPYDP